MTIFESELRHHGIMGQKWGKKNGPPYPLGTKRLSIAERYHRYKERRKRNSSEYKKSNDFYLTKKDTMMTLSYDKHRIKKSNMYYAAYEEGDKHTYNALFNKPVKDAKGNTIRKYKINTRARTDLKVASEDSAAKTFDEMFRKDREFRKFVMDKKRMRTYFEDEKYRFKGYREAKQVLEKMDDPKYRPDKKDTQTIYRLFNYVIPYTGGGKDERGAKDVERQRQKFFDAMKKNGYGGLLDTNDSLYGGYKTTSSVIIFDMENIVHGRAYMTKAEDVKKSRAYLVGRKILGI